MSVPLIKYSGNGQLREELLFSLACGDHLSKDWTRLEPKICFLLCRKRCLKNAGHPCCLLRPLGCSPMWWSAKVAEWGFFWSLVFFPSVLWMLLLSDRKCFYSTVLDCAACCLAWSPWLLAPAGPNLNPAMQEWTLCGASSVGQKLSSWQQPLDGLYLASCRSEYILKLAVSNMFVVCALFCS